MNQLLLSSGEVVIVKPDPYKEMARLMKIAYRSKRLLRRLCILRGYLSDDSTPDEIVRIIMRMTYVALYTKFYMEKQLHP